MGFELKHFTPEQLAKLSALNPGLSELLTPPGKDPDQLLLEAMELNTETWQKLERAYTENTLAMKEYVKTKRGKPLFQKGELLAALLFFCLLLVLI